jgi:hypothetical protein
LFLFCVFGLHSSSRSRTKLSALWSAEDLSFPNLHTKTPKIPHKTKKSPLQAQNQFAASKAKQSKATRTRTRTRKLWTWPKSHTETHTHTHTHTPTSKTQHQNASAFVLGRKNPSLKLDHLSKSFFAYMGKQIQSQLQKSQLSLALFFSFGIFIFFFNF